MSSEFKALLNNIREFQGDLQEFLDTYKKVEESTDRTVLSVEERSQFALLSQVQEEVWEAYHLLQMLNKPVKAQGYLEKNINGRYEVDGLELSSGQYIEVFDEDGYYPSRIEHNGEDYYIIALGRDKSIQGLKVRVK